ncbi:Ribose transport system permease protein rbsC [uncultured Roseburia sp.]|uniref:ABC transporter permease n=1 Tax=Brotonthovivens ammoniilytica TaxID=2981725 RepID=A0ABT2TFU8_9FIRM|nr:ABC transporter permease [Brotonthovivens ammoniilytica]MCU6761064.1 ABC transporter permease [Brotonthovivens ammoniilytica]SCI17815.1 Ribose transport system permease protein rbsC [uncultured Roseburia sp.]
MKEKEISARSLKAYTKAIAVLIVIIAALVILNIITEGKLLSVSNIKIMISSATVPTMIALGFTFLFACNVTDLSPGALVILTATAAGVLGNQFGVVPMIIGSILLGMGCGLLNFTIYRVTKIPPWIAGLGMTMVYEAIVGYYSSVRAAQGLKVVVLEDDKRFLGQQPGIYIMLIIGLVAAYILYNHTTLGINMRAAGCNEDVASVMGIRVSKALILGGLVSGFFFGYAGIIKESYASFVNAQSGLSSLSTTFQPLAAVLLAKALSKYINRIAAIPIGTFLIVLVFNVLTLLGVPSGTFQETLLGVIVVVFGILAQKNVKGVVK